MAKVPPVLAPDADHLARPCGYCAPGGLLRTFRIPSARRDRQFRPAGYGFILGVLMFVVLVFWLDRKSTERRMPNVDRNCEGRYGSGGRARASGAMPLQLDSRR